MLLKISMLSLVAIASAAPQLGILGTGLDGGLGLGLGVGIGGTSSQSVAFGTPLQITRPLTPAFGISGITTAGVLAEHHSHPKYKFHYNVNDHHTGDHKSHWEARDGDQVRGAYSLVDPDGTIRRVEYTADALNGFNAVVTRKGHAKHPITHRKIIATAGLGRLGTLTTVGTTGIGTFGPSIGTGITTGLGLGSTAIGTGFVNDLGGDLNGFGGTGLGGNLATIGNGFDGIL